MEPNIQKIPWQGREPTFQGFTNEDLLFQLAAVQAKSHPELVALRARHDVEVNQVTSPLMLGISCKDKEDALELLYVRGRFNAARDMLRSLHGVDVSEEMTALLTLEHKEVARRIEAQGTNRVQRVQRLGKMLECVRAFKEQDHDEYKEMLHNNALLELHLRKFMINKELEEQQQLEARADRTVRNIEAASHQATSQDTPPGIASYADASKTTSLRPHATAFNPRSPI